MFLHELRHVDTDHGLFGIEQEFGERLAQLRLAHTGGPEKQKGSVGSVGIGQPGPRAPHRVGDRNHGFVLTDDTAVQGVLHAQQLVALALEHLGHRDARPLGHHLGDLLVGHLVAHQLALPTLRLGGLGEPAFELRNRAVLELTHAREITLAPGGLHLHLVLIQLGTDIRRGLQGGLFGLPNLLQIGVFALCLGDFPLQFGQPRGRLPVGFLFDYLSFHLELNQASVEAVHLLGHGVDLHADAARRLVDQVDGLVGQLAIGDVPVRQARRGDDRGIGDLHIVVDLIALLEAAQNGNGVLFGRLVDQNLLESPLQGGVLLDVLAVFVKRGRAHAVQLTPRQRRLEHIAGVHGTLGLAGADHGVQLIDEQDHPALLLGELVEHPLEALLEFAAELGSGDQGAHIQRQHPFVLESLRHLTVDDALGQTLDDGGLAHTGLADQHRVVLGAPLQYLNGAADLVIAADHRVELAGPRPLGEIDGVLFQRLALAFGIRTLHCLSSAHALDRALEFIFVAKTVQQRPQLAMIERGQEQGFDRDELIALLLGQLVGEIQQTHQLGGDADLSGRALHDGQTFQLSFQLPFQTGQIEAGLGQQRTRRTAAVAQQRAEHVNRLQGTVVAAHGDRLRIRQGVLQCIGEAFLSHGLSSGSVGDWGVIWGRQRPISIPVRHPPAPDHAGYWPTARCWRTMVGVGKTGRRRKASSLWRTFSNSNRAEPAGWACVNTATTPGRPARTSASTSSPASW